jgi:hypothetical protein
VGALDALVHDPTLMSAHPTPIFSPSETCPRALARPHTPCDSSAAARIARRDANCSATRRQKGRKVGVSAGWSGGGESVGDGVAHF